MKPSFFRVLLTLVTIANPLLADTFVMKDGSKLEAEVMKEDDSSYLLEVQVTSSIKDEKTVAKKDVLRIEKASKESMDYEVISAFWPTPDGLTAQDYNERMAKVSKFTLRYPESPHIRKVREMYQHLKGELTLLEQGGRKLNGKMVSKKDYQTNALEFDSLTAAGSIKRLVADRQYLQALRDFRSFEKDFRQTQAYLDLVPLMVRVIGSYASEVSQLSASYPSRMEQRTKGLDRMSGESRKISERAIAEENAALLSQFNTQKASNVGWVTPHPFCKPALDEATTFANSELKRLQDPKILVIKDQGKMFREVMSMIDQGAKTADIKKAIEELRKTAASKRYIDQLEEAMSAKPSTP